MGVVLHHEVAGRGDDSVFRHGAFDGDPHTGWGR